MVTLVHVADARDTAAVLRSGLALPKRPPGDPLLAAMPMTKLLGVLLLLAPLLSWAGPAPLPAEVRLFIEQREACDHWRGEAGYDEDRQKDIDWSVCQACSGTDAELSRLKRKYRRNARVVEALGVFDAHIEPADKAASVRFCRATRRPDWKS